MRGSLLTGYDPSPLDTGNICRSRLWCDWIPSLQVTKDLKPHSEQTPELMCSTRPIAKAKKMLDCVWAKFRNNVLCSDKRNKCECRFVQIVPRIKAHGSAGWAPDRESYDYHTALVDKGNTDIRFHFILKGLSGSGSPF